MVRILLADGHPLIRIGLRITFEQENEFSVVGEAANGPDTTRLCDEVSPDILVLDTNMPGVLPAPLINCIRKRNPKIKIIVLTTNDDESFVRSIIGIGVSGYILKNECPEILVRAITAAMNGDGWFSRRIVETLARTGTGPNSINNCFHLTDRETEVLHLIAKGYANCQIAKTLTIADGTVKNHMVNIYQKLGVHTRAEAVAWAWQHGNKQGP